MDLQFAPLSSSTWQDLETLFGRRGACGGCWCMLWRSPQGGRALSASRGEPNRSALHARVLAGRPQGCLAYEGGAPVGWISCAPREEFPYFARSRSVPFPASREIWAITCIFVARRARGRGVASALVGAAVELATRDGATAVQAFPVPARRDRIPDAFAWTGLPGIYARAGFVQVSHPVTGRTFMERRSITVGKPGK